MRNRCRWASNRRPRALGRRQAPTPSRMLKQTPRQCETGGVFIADVVPRCRPYQCSHQFCGDHCEISSVVFDDRRIGIRLWPTAPMVSSAQTFEAVAIYRRHWGGGLYERHPMQVRSGSRISAMRAFERNSKQEILCGGAGRRRNTSCPEAKKDLAKAVICRRGDMLFAVFDAASCSTASVAHRFMRGRSRSGTG